MPGMATYTVGNLNTVTCCLFLPRLPGALHHGLLVKMLTPSAGSRQDDDKTLNAGENAAEHHCNAVLWANLETSVAAAPRNPEQGSKLLLGYLPVYMYVPIYLSIYRYIYIHICIYIYISLNSLATMREFTSAH